MSLWRSGPTLIGLCVFRGFLFFGFYFLFPRFVVYYLIFQPNGRLNCFFFFTFSLPLFFGWCLSSLYACRRRRDVTCRSDAPRYPIIIPSPLFFLWGVHPLHTHPSTIYKGHTYKWDFNPEKKSFFFFFFLIEKRRVKMFINNNRTPQRNSNSILLLLLRQRLPDCIIVYTYSWGGWIVNSKVKRKVLLVQIEPPKTSLCKSNKAQKQTKKHPNSSKWMKIIRATLECATKASGPNWNI
jgi:hypothetical protein